MDGVGGVIAFGGSKYQGVNFSVALGLPSYIDGMSGIEGVLTVKTVGDWAVGVSGAASFATFAIGAELAIQSKDGTPYPDTLRFYVGRFTPGINLDGMGVLWLQGAGGGIDDLYDTIFLTDAIPPLQLILQGQFSILQIISARAELGLSLQGIGAQLSNGTLANSVTMLDSAQLELGWYPEVYFLAALNMNIAGILHGGGYIVSDKSELFEFFIQAALTLPGNLPLIGGLTLANVGLGANTEKIWGAAEALGMKVGITYYWGGDISWNGEEATSSHPELMTFRAVAVDSANTVTSTAEKAEWQYTNSIQPAKPTMSNVKSTGDYKVSFAATSDGDIDGYRVNFYEGEQLVLDDKGHPIVTGRAILGLEAGKTSKMGVSTYKEANGVTLYSEETLKEISVPQPNPPAFSWNADVNGVTDATTRTTQAGKETFKTLIYPKNGFTATITEAKGPEGLGHLGPARWRGNESFQPKRHSAETGKPH